MKPLVSMQNLSSANNFDGINSRNNIKINCFKKFKIFNKLNLLIMLY